MIANTRSSSLAATADIGSRGSGGSGGIQGEREGGREDGRAGIDWLNFIVALAEVRMGMSYD